MKNIIKKLKKNLKGFTLVELLGVIVILAIIMVIAIPSVLEVIRSARVKSFINYGEKIISKSSNKTLLEELDYEEEGYTVIYDLDDLDFDNKGNYKAYVLVTVTEDGYKYKITLHDDEDMVIGYDYSNNKGMSNVKLENYDSNDPKLTPEYLCSLSKSSVCIYKDKEIINNNYIDVNDDTEEGFKNIAKIIADAADDKFKNSDYNNDLTKPACVLYDLEDLGFTNLGSYVAYAYVIPVDNNTRRIVLYLYNQYYLGGSTDYYTYGFESEDSRIMAYNEEVTYEMVKNELNSYTMIMVVTSIGEDSCFSLNYKGNYINKDGETNDEEFWKKLNPEYSGEGGSEEPSPTPETPTPETPTPSPSGSYSNAIYACGSGNNDPSATTTSLCTGERVNVALKKLINDKASSYEDIDTIVTAIKFTATKPSSSTKVANISPYNSKEVLAWLDDTTIYIYSSSSEILLNSDSSKLFSNFKKVTSIELNRFNTSNVTDMSYMFYDCVRVTGLDVSHFDTSKVRNFAIMFLGCEKLTSLDVSGFNTSSASDFSGMFQSCSSLVSLDVSHFDTSNATDLDYMFNNCAKLEVIDVSHFNTSKVTNMYSMFQWCYKVKVLDVSGFNTSKVRNFGSMFSYCQSIKTVDLSHFDTSSATDMHFMFYCCSALTILDLSSFNTSKVTDMNHMFVGLNNITTLDISNFNTLRVTNMEGMFWMNNKLNTIYIGSGWDTSLVKNSDKMFKDSTKLPNYNSKYTDKTKAYAGSGGYLTLKA